MQGPLFFSEGWGGRGWVIAHHMADSNVSQSCCKWKAGWGWGWGVVLWLLSAMKFTTSTCGWEQVKGGILQVKGGMRSHLSLALENLSSPDYTPPLFIRKHPTFHLQLPLWVPPFTCISILHHPLTIPHRSSLQNVPTFTCSCSGATSNECFHLQAS